MFVFVLAWLGKLTSLKGPMSRYFDLYLGSLKVVVDWKETLNNSLPG